MHLLTAEAAWAGLRAALPGLAASPPPSSFAASPPSWPEPLASGLAKLAAEFLAASPEESANPAERLSALAEAIDGAGERRLLDFTAGVRAYRAHPYRRALSDPPVVWRDGTTRLLDYGGAGRRDKGAVLVVPSLVNRAYVLDLTAKTSLMRHLVRQGFRPFLVDWDAPGAVEKAFGLDDYIAGRLEGALDAALAEHGGPVAALGYCMGGNLALALALRRPRDVTGLACLATPWDFHAEGPITAPLAPAAAASLSAAIAALPEFPVDLLQAMFASLDPFLVNRKFRAFATGRSRRAASPAAEDPETLFVAVEDWVNDGVPLASRVASECLIGWYGENAPARGTWCVAGQPVRPADLACPALVIIPARDRIVPPATAQALAAALPRAQTVTVPSGHVAMVVGDRGPSLTWAPLTAWLESLQPARRAGKPRAASRKPVAKRSHRATRTGRQPKS